MSCFVLTSTSRARNSRSADEPLPERASASGGWRPEHTLDDGEDGEVGLGGSVQAVDKALRGDAILQELELALQEGRKLLLQLLHFLLLLLLLLLQQLLSHILGCLKVALPKSVPVSGQR